MEVAPVYLTLANCEQGDKGSEGQRCATANGTSPKRVQFGNGSGNGRREACSRQVKKRHCPICRVMTFPRHVSALID